MAIFKYRYSFCVDEDIIRRYNCRLPVTEGIVRFAVEVRSNFMVKGRGSFDGERMVGSERYAIGCCREELLREDMVLRYRRCGAAMLFITTASCGGCWRRIVSEKKNGYVLPRAKMVNADLGRIMNSDEVQSVVKPIKKEVKRAPLKKNPLKNLNVMLKLNPYAKAARTMALLAKAQRVKAKQKSLRRRGSQSRSGGISDQICYKTIISDSDYTEFENFTKWLDVFGSREELMDWVQNMAHSLGVVIVKKRSNTKPCGFLYRVVLMCDRGGDYKVKDSSKVSGTKKINCPFELEGKYLDEYDSWRLRVICDKHNHKPAQYMEGHPYAKRLSEDEYSLVAELTTMNVAPRDILSILKQRNVNNVSTLKTIYNARNKIRMIEQVGKSPMQVF
ncbi:hypothetical protein OROHE_019277 [Orobanche hederae]